MNDDMDHKLGGLSRRLYNRIEVFRKKHKYTCWHFDFSEPELTFYKGQESFCHYEYKQGSPIKIAWEKLESECVREMRRF